MSAPVHGNWRRAEYLALALCMSIGLLLSIAPHLATLLHYGTWEYLADGDETQYMAIARVAYQGENALRDPYAGKWEGLPTQYPWIPFGPTAQFNRLAGLPLLASTLEWRLVGGLLFGAVLFILFRLLFGQTLHPVGWALGCSLICLADAGFIQGRSLVQNLTLVPHLLQGTTPLTKADAIPQFRVASPLLMLPFLLLLAASFLPAARQTKRWMLVGAVGLGVCCQMYFFFWTAAIAGIVGFVLAHWVQVWRKQANWSGALATTKFSALIIAGGLLIGAPQLYQTYKISAQPQYKPLLQRLCRGQKVPWSNPFRRMNIVNVWTWSKLLAGAVGILFFRLPGLGLLWWLTFAGYALSNSALATGLEFENWHWNYVHAPMGEILLLGVAAMLLDKLRRIPLMPLWALPILLVTIAAIWRPYEALAAPEAAHNSRALAELKPLRESLARLDQNHLLAGPSPEADIALLFCKCGRLYHPYTATLSFISDEDANTRHALNGWLQGLPRPTYLDPAAQGIFSPCAIVNPLWEPAAVLGQREILFSHFQSDPAAAAQSIAKYRADYLLLPDRVVPDQPAGPWTLLQQASPWKLWIHK